MLVLRHKVFNLNTGPHRFRVILNCQQDTYSTPWSDPIATTLCGNGVVEIGEDCESGLFKSITGRRSIAACLLSPRMPGRGKLRQLPI